jgi:hypothetical protein
MNRFERGVELAREKPRFGYRRLHASHGNRTTSSGLVPTSPGSSQAFAHTLDTIVDLEEFASVDAQAVRFPRLVF